MQAVARIGETLVAALLAADPALGGVVWRGPPSDARDGFLADLRALLPGQPWRRLPLHIGDERLLGGLDLAATLAAGKPLSAIGLLAECEGGTLVVASAERVTPATAARIAHALDTGSGFRLLLLDEGVDDERAPAALLDRCAFALGASSPDAAIAPRASRDDAAAGDGALEAICAATAVFGIDSARAPLLALRAARSLAAFDDSASVDADHVATAAKLVLAWRATRLPAPESQPESGEESAPPDQPAPPESEGESKSLESLEDRAIEAVRASIPPHLLAALAAGPSGRGKGGGRAPALVRQGTRHGRPAGTRRGSPRDGARLALIDTLRAAAPWQKIRRAPGDGRIAVRRDDFRIHRTKPRAETTTIFAVDASGSAALARLAEAKGAVERLLAECYVRRDRVAVIAFRGTRADILLPPTRSLARAKRALAQLPGGGGTPLAAGLIAASGLADATTRAGGRPAIVVLTDGRANVARDGAPGRATAESEAHDAARRIAAARIPCLLIDTAIRPQPIAQAIARSLAARYFPLPQADARAIVRAIQQGA